ncbi:MAG: FCD domain-containing protein [Candidatus Thiodiazotropha sp.]
MREALSKLSSLGFVVFDSRRGFRVAAMSKDDLADLTRMRKLVELDALRISIESHDDEWDVGVIAATARLQRLKARNGTETAPTLGEIERAHRQFHLALLTGCHSRRLATLQEVFYDQAQRYRHVMISQELDLDEFVSVHAPRRGGTQSRLRGCSGGALRAYRAHPPHHLSRPHGRGNCLVFTRHGSQLKRPQAFVRKKGTLQSLKGRHFVRSQ